MIFDKVVALLAEQMNLSVLELKADMSITDDLGADSLDVLEMLMGVEEHFGVTISDEDAKNIKTIGDVVAYIESNQ